MPTKEEIMEACQNENEKIRTEIKELNRKMRVMNKQYDLNKGVLKMFMGQKYQQRHKKKKEEKLGQE